jgi:hypothetical protein
MSVPARDLQHKVRPSGHLNSELLGQHLPHFVELGRDLDRLLGSQVDAAARIAAVAATGMSLSEAVLCVGLYGVFGHLDFARLDDETWQELEKQHFSAVLAWTAARDPTASQEARKAALRHLDGNPFSALALFSLEGGLE